MGRPKIAIVLSTTRLGRFGDKPAEWILKLASKREAAEFESVDLRDYPLPFFAEAMSPAWAPAKHEIARRWASKVDEADGFIFVTGNTTTGSPPS
jgi:NAD(P)H-dependent FMN reductase